MATAAPVKTPPTQSEAQARNAAQRTAEQQATNPKKQPKLKPVKNMQPASTLEPPELPISGDKKQKLDELLRRYQADQVTPEQYHQERAKILAAP